MQHDCVVIVANCIITVVSKLILTMVISSTLTGEYHIPSRSHRYDYTIPIYGFLITRMFLLITRMFYGAL